MAKRWNIHWSVATHFLIVSKLETWNWEKFYSCLDDEFYHFTSVEMQVVIIITGSLLGWIWLGILRTKCKRDHSLPYRHSSDSNFERLSVSRNIKESKRANNIVYLHTCILVFYDTRAYKSSFDGGCEVGRASRQRVPWRHELKERAPTSQLS